MTISLSKGQNVSLSKIAPTLSTCRIGTGWDARSSDGAEFDLDVSAFLLGADGKVLSDRHFIFYNQLKSDDGSVLHSPDNRTGAGEGDDEWIDFELNKIPSSVLRIVVAVTIDDAAARKQNFGMVKNAYARVVDQTSTTELVRFDLSEDASTETAMIFAELYRNAGEWKFKAIAQGYKDGLIQLCREFGVSV